jgi:hypothetical protein
MKLIDRNSEQADIWEWLVLKLGQQTKNNNIALWR